MALCQSQDAHQRTRTGQHRSGRHATTSVPAHAALDLPHAPQRRPLWRRTRHTVSVTLYISFARDSRRLSTILFLFHPTNKINKETSTSIAHRTTRSAPRKTIVFEIHESPCTDDARENARAVDWRTRQLSFHVLPPLPPPPASNPARSAQVSRCAPSILSTHSRKLFERCLPRSVRIVGR